MKKPARPKRGPLRLFTFLFPLILLSGAVLAQDFVPPSPADLSGLTDGTTIYTQACSTCHGPDGRGASLEHVGFDTPLPDFTDCSFASREQSAEWVGVAHEGGPLRGFSHIMPSFGQALTIPQLEAAVAHIRDFCTDKQWPRGEFNLPRPIVTGKAFVEDETLLISSIDTEGNGAVENTLVMEKRFGKRSEFELAVPYAWEETTRADGSKDWQGGIGNVGVELKHVMFDNLASGSIVSAAAELVLPTGSLDTTVFEPQLLYGQMLAADAFFHSQVGLELPVDRSDPEDEMYWRLALGRTFTEANWGRAWTPMLEVLGSKVIDESDSTQWDLMPELQVSLSKRQHIQLNLGLRLPVSHSTQRDTLFMMSFLWDWYDGGLREGW